jgi:hypothetical protein
MRTRQDGYHSSHCLIVEMRDEDECQPPQSLILHGCGTGTFGADRDRGVSGELAVSFSTVGSEPWGRMNEAMAALSERRSGKRLMIADSDGSSKVMTEAFAERTRHERAMDRECTSRQAPPSHVLMCGDHSIPVENTSGAG